MHFLALCSSSFRKTMSAKATATAAWDWKNPEAADQAPGPYPISAPIQVPPSPPLDPHVLPPKGFQKPWKGKVGKGGKEIELPEEAYEKNAETPTEYWWAHPDGMWLQTFWIWLCVSRHFHAKCGLSLSYLHPTYFLCCRRG